MLSQSEHKNMNSSLFSRIFAYRQRENNSPIENFLIEIFTFCIETDEKFRKDFFIKILKLISIENDFKISTQEVYVGYGRPDIEISFGNSIFLIECKVETSERENQLEDYSLILLNKKEKYKSKHIIFLTKYFEHKVIKSQQILLHLVRWFSVYEIIDHSHSSITQQLKNFLKDQKMEKIQNFTIEDLLAMKIIPETITKMDELLESIKSEFTKLFGSISKDSSRSTRLPNSLYINYVVLKFNKLEYWVLIGFFWWWEGHDVPYVGISIEIPKRKFDGSELVKLLNNELIKKRNWELDDGETHIYYNALKPLSDFITGIDDNIPSMKKYLQQQLLALYQIKEKYPKVFARRNIRKFVNDKEKDFHG